MIRLARNLAVVAGLAAAGGLAVAQDRTTGNEGLPGRSPSGAAETSSPGATGTGAAAAVGDDDCAHQMTGTVTKLDAAAGTLSIDVAGGNGMTLRLPASELKGFEEGDQVVVSLGVRESRATAPSAQDRDPRGARTVP
jgi:hypothetical protein